MGDPREPGAEPTPGLHVYDAAGRIQPEEFEDELVPGSWLQHESMFDRQFEEDGTFPSFISKLKIQELEESCWKDDRRRGRAVSKDERDADYERKMVCWNHHIPWLKGLREKALEKPNGARLLDELDRKAVEVEEEKKKERAKMKKEREQLKTMSPEESARRQAEWCQRQRARRTRNSEKLNRNKVSGMRWIRKDTGHPHGPAPAPDVAEGAVPQAAEAMD